MKRKHLADRLGLSLNWVYGVLCRAEFQKHQIGNNVLITDAFKSDMIDYLYKRINSSQTSCEYRVKYCKLVNSQLSCLDN